MAEPSISIVVPCYNEATRLATSAFRQFVSAAPHVRFLFVNDGSADDTGGVLQRLADSDPAHFAQLSLPANHGKAEAVRLGMVKVMQGDVQYAGYWDADLATPLDEIPRFVAALEANPDYEICFGSRVRLLGRAIERRPLRHYLGRLFATVASHVLRLPVYDTQCGAKLFRVTNDARTIFAEPFCVNWTFDVEIIARVQALQPEDKRLKGASVIYELPLNEWHDVAGSKVFPSDFFKALLEMLRIHEKYRRPRARRQ